MILKIGSFNSWVGEIAKNHMIETEHHVDREQTGGKIHHVAFARKTADDSLEEVLNWVCADSNLPELSARRKEAKEAIQVCLPCLDTVRLGRGGSSLFRASGHERDRRDYQ